MANTYNQEPINGGDNGIWGPKELYQNRVATGAISCQLYDDSGTLKITVGQIGFDNDSGNGVVDVDTVTTISLAGINNSRWFTVELTRVGSTPSFTAVELAADQNPYALPTGLDGYYDPVKGGYYRVGTGRIVGLGWKSTAGALAGIVNVQSIIEGYAGYSTGEVVGHVYTWDNRLSVIYDANYAGNLHVLKAEDRSSSWILNGGTDTSFTDVDFSAYVPVGTKALLIHLTNSWTGDGALDDVNIFAREKGSSETGLINVRMLQTGFSNFGSGLNMNTAGIQIIPCDSNGEIQYYTSSAANSVFMTLWGYFI